MMGSLRNRKINKRAEDDIAFWIIQGAEPESDDDDPDDVPGGDPDDEDEDDSDDDSEDDSDDSSDDDGDDKDDDADKDDDDDLKYWKSKANRLERQKQAADRRATEAERENRRLKKGKDDALDEPGKEDLATAQSAAAESAKTVNSLRLQVALLSDTTYSWHDPALVIQSLASDGEVEIDEDGKVVGVKRALSRLAKSKPYLVKPGKASASSKTDKTEGKPAGESNPKRSGAPTSGRRSQQGSVDRAKLLKQYPMLANR